ncbi:MAG: hypothetical protein HYR94_29685 [Chloroflexi bacterium]|nr:hypothetical protein [Chloroflexota bacterium]
MHETFKRTLWLTALMLLSLVLLGITSCGGNSLILLGQPGQPTLVFIYSDG